MPFLERLVRFLALAAIVSLAWRAPLLLLGAVLFAALTLLVTPWGSTGARPPTGELAVVMLVVLVLAVLPWTRWVGLGFFAGLLLATVVLDGFFARIWWDVPARYVGRMMRPSRDAARRRAGQSSWVLLHRDAPMDVNGGAFRLYQLSEGMLRVGFAARTDGRFPTAMELTEPEDYRGARGEALDIEDVEFPDRYGPGDMGWRWTLAPSTTPSWRGQPGWLLTMRPDPVLKRDGPILELDGQELLRIREREGAPSRVLRTPIPLMRRMRECILAAGADAGADSLRWKYLPGSVDTRRACRELLVEESGSVPADGSMGIGIRTKLPAGGEQLWSEPTWLSYLYESPGRFQLRGSEHLRRYMLSADGTLHVTAGLREAQVTDPAPLPCEVDPAVRCE